MNLNLFGHSDDPPTPAGMVVLRGRLSRAEQAEFVRLAFEVADDAPFYTPVMRGGAPFRVQMTSAGDIGWLSDEAGYRYARVHPETKRPWPEIPEPITSFAKAAALEAGFSGFTPDSCLFNLYRSDGKLGIHRDHVEQDRVSPIVSVSLGDSCVFKFGGLSKGGPFTDWTLVSGDVVVFGGPSRLAWHGVSKILRGTSDLIPGGGRMNLTVRRAMPA